MPAASIFQQAARDALRALGEESFFNGSTEPTWINIQHGVQMTGVGSDEAMYRGGHVANSDVATIMSDLQPQTGKTFTQSGSTYKLGALVRDNGYTKSYVVLKVA